MLASVDGDARHRWNCVVYFNVLRWCTAQGGRDRPRRGGAARSVFYLLYMYIGRRATGVLLRRRLVTVAVAHFFCSASWCLPRGISSWNWRAFSSSAPAWSERRLERDSSPRGTK